MKKKSSRNNNLLGTTKAKVSPKIYSMLLKLVNEGREELAEDVLKVDYLIQYGSTCVKQKDFEEARETLAKISSRIDALKKEKVDTEYLDYLTEGIKKIIK